MPQRPEGETLIMAVALLLIGFCLGALTASALGFFLALIITTQGGTLWQAYWKKRDEWRRWQAARQQERERPD